jgi:hypothetical protein
VPRPRRQASCRRTPPDRHGLTRTHRSHVRPHRRRPGAGGPRYRHLRARVRLRFFDGAHVVAAAVRTADGDVYDGVSLPASVGRASLCAEPVAVGSAVADGHRHDDLETCVAVAYPLPEHDADETRVIPPCGICRELLTTTRTCGW